ncbi:hypothetical protein [Sulfurisphaera ohwakuensis]|uniref:hypothetical protein n=1 Tax=Sulfurisphaera ohwakuensis TaxID=69656 RepID=UPI0036F2F5F3
MIRILSISAQTILNYLYEAYNYLVQFIAHILQITIFQADPGLATQYATLISYLIPLTAIYIILVFASGLKKIIGYLVAAGWGFIILMLILAKVG